MNLVSIELARVLQLFNADEIKPRKGFYPPEFRRMVGERYRFATLPDIEKKIEGGLKFGFGQFVTGERTINIADLTVYNDGVAVEATNSDDADIVLTEFIEWIKENLGINEPTTIIPRSYISGVVVDFDAPIDHAWSLFQAFAEIATDIYGAVYNVTPKFALSRIGLTATDRGTPAIINPELIIERRGNISLPSKTNRHYCSAALPSDFLIELMSRFEKIALSSK